MEHIVSEEGIQPDPCKLSNVTEFPIARNVKGLRAFLGLTGYYKRFSPLYVEEITALLEFMKKKCEVEVGTSSHKCVQQGQGIVCRKHYATSSKM